MMTDSQQLLADYKANGSEKAFRELVSRYVDLVYSTALRLVDGDTHRAKDVVQTVFLDLVRMSGKLSADTMLGGWLHRHTCFVARTVMRGERRRLARERQAVEMSAIENTPDAALTEMAPVLDEAINALGPDDRDVILLRFFERRNLRAVGEALGINENMAQKRVARALQELGFLLRQRGVTLSAAALAGGLAAGAVKAAPAGLALGVAQVALAGAGGTAVAGGVATATAKVAMLTKLHLGLISCLLVGGLTITGLLHYQSKTLSREAVALTDPPSTSGSSSTLLPSTGQPVFRSSPREIAPAAPRRESQPALDPIPSASPPTPTAPAAAPGRSAAVQADQTESDEPTIPMHRFAGRSGSRVRIEGTSNIHDWQVVGSIIGGFLDLSSAFVRERDAALKPGPVPARAEVYIPIRSLKSVEKDGRPYSDKMDEIMYGKLQCKSGRITYRLTDLSLTGTTNSSDGLAYLFDSRGELVVAGVTNGCTMPVRVQPLTDGRVKVTGLVALRMTSFKIQPPAVNLAIASIRTGDEVTVMFEWLLGLTKEIAPVSQHATVPLVLQLPAPAFKSTPKDLKPRPTVEPLSDKPRPPLMVPRGLRNLALGAKITTSDPNALPATLAKIRDGDKAPTEESIVFLRKGLQWVQLDLGGSHEIFAVVLWHAHDALKVYRDVVVQLSDKADFSGNVRTLFNNDQDDSSDLGPGTDREYFETNEGRLIQVKGLTGRFLRCYSKGSDASALNEYTEIEVYGRPGPD